MSDVAILSGPVSQFLLSCGPPPSTHEIAEDFPSGASLFVSFCGERLYCVFFRRYNVRKKKTADRSANLRSSGGEGSALLLVVGLEAGPTCAWWRLNAK